jgi:hypothetical protein
VAIFSIAHLDDAQRMFFVTILLNEILAWIRAQPGTSSLRALLYMDEVFGYFPPLANPPAKRPMLTLLKQARAYGLGCVLATQNPVDLDYKGLSNAGTWFLGRLQTERDKARVIEGLEGASTQAGSTFNRQQMEATLAALGSRVFLMNNVHDDAPVVFHTRWAMSYLCGPLTRGQIKTLMDPVRAQFAKSADRAAEATAFRAAANRPVLPAGVHESFAAIREPLTDEYRLEYRPGLFGVGKVHFVRKGDNVDAWRECVLLQTIGDAPTDDVWEAAIPQSNAITTVAEPDGRGRFAELPSEFARAKTYSVIARQLKEHLYREESFSFWKCGLLNEKSRAGEKEEQFRQRLTPLLAARLDVEREKLERTHSAKLADAEERVRKAQARVSTQRWQFLARLGSMAWVVVDTVLSAMGKGLPGRRRSLDPAFRSASTERGQQSTAQIGLEAALKEKQRIEEEYQEKLKPLGATYSPANVQLEQIELKPQKSDIEVDGVSLVWLPWRIDATGAAQPVY